MLGIQKTFITIEKKEHRYGSSMVHKYLHFVNTLPETNSLPLKWLVGIRFFPIGEAYFQGR